MLENRLNPDPDLESQRLGRLLSQLERLGAELAAVDTQLHQIRSEIRGAEIVPLETRPRKEEKMSVAKLFFGVAFGVLSMTLAGSSVRADSPGPDVAQVGDWTGAAWLGFLSETPDDTAFAVNGNLETFLSQEISVGPLLQLGFTDDMTLVGLSGQAKYWFPLDHPEGRTKLFLQGGVGFIHADFRNDDTSWLVPLGVGLEYAFDNGTALTATFLLNFTDLDDTSRSQGDDADIMPGFGIGLRF